MCVCVCVCHRDQNVEVHREIHLQTDSVFGISFLTFGRGEHWKDENKDVEKDEDVKDTHLITWKTERKGKRKQQKNEGVQRVRESERE